MNIYQIQALDAEIRHKVLDKIRNEGIEIEYQSFDIMKIDKKHLERVKELYIEIHKEVMLNYKQ